jgi:hypothetical protein
MPQDQEVTDRVLTSTTEEIDTRAFLTDGGARPSHLSGSLGVASSWGTTEGRELGSIISGQATTTRLKIRTATILY